MTNEPKVLRIVVALAGDVPEARDDLNEAVRELNRVAEDEGREGRFEIAAWYEEAAGHPFYRESPRALVEDIYRAHNPDIITGVFWGRFGTARLDPTPGAEQILERAEDEHRLAEAAWRRPEHPRVMLYLCDRKLPAPRDDEERAQQTYVTLFRGLFTPGSFWWPYRKRSEFRNTPHEQELHKVVFAQLLKDIRRWPITNPPARANASPAPKLHLPYGWKLLDPLELSVRRGELEAGGKLSKRDALNYFNGTEPSWEVALSKSIRRRHAVGELVGKIVEAAYAERLRVTALTGPGGEGKSTMLRQMAVDLAERYPDIYVIWRDKQGAALEEGWLRQLLKERGSFVIASDNAAGIANDVYLIAESLRDEPRLNVQFLLASRSIEWIWERVPEDYYWRRRLSLGDNFKRLKVSGLDLENGDAARVVAAMEEAGPEGLGTLASHPEGERARILARMAHDEAIKNPLEGSFLGALLRVRKREEMHTRGSGEEEDDPFEGYVREILDRLKEQSVPGGKNLLDAFAYIAALHADWDRENWPIPSKPILARALSCSVDELEQKVLKPLADEAMTSASPEWFVLARHRDIARAAKRILNTSAKFERQIYPELLCCARQAFLAKPKEIDKYEVGPWNNLPRLYFKRGQLDLALRLAEVLADVEPYDPIPVVSWAHIYRDAGKKPEAANIFRRRFDVLLKEIRKREGDYPNKGYFLEWSVSEGQSDNHCFSTWLCGIALSDKTEEKEGGTPPMTLLSGVSTSLGELFKKAADPSNPRFHNPSHAQTFRRACAAAAQLGRDERVKLKPGPDYDKAVRHLREGEILCKDRDLPAPEPGKDRDLPAPEPGEAFQHLYEGVRLAWELRGKDNGKLPDSLPDFTDLRFRELKGLFGVAGEPEARTTSVIKTPTPRGY
jgi:hypothetical protein